MNEQEIRLIIRKRINLEVEPDGNEKYDGFDMSGYDNSNYSNLELLARFKDLMNINQGDENRQSNCHVPMFWKGGGEIINIGNQRDSQVIEDIGGETTEDIIFKIISLQNKKLIT